MGTWRQGGKKIALRGGGGGDTEAHFPNPPSPLLGRRDGTGGSGRGYPTCRAGGGGSTQHLGGVFAQRAHSAGTAPIITLIIQVTTLKTTHLRIHAQSIQNSKIQTSDACHGSQGPEFCPL